MVKNYNKFYVKNGEIPKSDNVILGEPVEEQISEEIEPIIEAPKEPRPAKVANCISLNLREGPSKTKTIVCVLPVGEDLIIEDIVDGWAHVYTSAGLDGFVMAEFIKE